MEKIKVAIADDHALMRKGVSALLQKFDNVEVVFEAVDGIDLLEKIGKQSIHVVLLDLRMPRLNGFDTLVRAKKEYPHVKIIILSLYQDAEIIIKGVESGANGYLLKDTEPEQLYATIKMVMEEGYYFNEEITALICKSLGRSRKIRLDLDSTVNLTQHQTQILNLICKGFTNEEIGVKLFLSPRTIEGHRKRLIAAFGCRNSIQMAVKAVRTGFVDISIEELD